MVGYVLDMNNKLVVQIEVKNFSKAQPNLS